MAFLNVSADFEGHATVGSGAFHLPRGAFCACAAGFAQPRAPPRRTEHWHCRPNSAGLRRTRRLQSAGPSA